MIDVFNVDVGIGLLAADATETQLLNGAADPSVALGVEAPISSQYTRPVPNGDGSYTVITYDKVGPLDTDWVARATTGTIGAAEDGSWADGLFGFNEGTRVGVAVDKINEFLTLMAPQKAPALTNQGATSTGASGKLSFDATHDIAGYSYDAALINASVSKAGDGVGLFSGAVSITGDLNSNVAANANTAWPAKAFGPGNEGVLALWVNGVVVHSIDLAAFASGSSKTGGSGFDMSVSTPVKFANGNEFVTFQYRTGTFTVAAAAQRPGYNFAQVKHNSSEGNVTTNTLFWYNSVDAQAITSSGRTLVPTFTGSRFLSGVSYYSAGTLRMQGTVQKAYRDCYSPSASALSFSCTQAAFASQTLPATTSNTADLLVDSTAALSSALRVLNASASATFTVQHPLKAAHTCVATASDTMLYDPITTSSVLIEYFNSEDYRVSDVPASAITVPTAYDSSVSLAVNGGLQFHNGYLKYPSLNFKNVADGGSIALAPAGNPSYVGLTGNRTFIRAFKNNSGLTKANFKLNIAGATTSFAAVGALTGNNMSVEVKFPQGSLSAGTGWMDAYKDFATAQWADGAGCRAGSYGNGRALATDWGVTVGTQSIAANEYVYVRFTAPASWAGYLDTITLTWI